VDVAVARWVDADLVSFFVTDTASVEGDRL